MIVDRMAVEPGTNRRLTLIACGICDRIGHFPVKRINLGAESVFACSDCSIKLGQYEPSIAEIQKKVCAHYGLRRLDMHSARRDHRVARPRQIAMYLCRRLTSCSLPQIGRHFGHRDHTTVMHAIRRIEQLRVNDADFDKEMKEVMSSISARISVLVSNATNRDNFFIADTIKADS
jgi:hypothetical protein